MKKIINLKNKYWLVLINTFILSLFLNGCFNVEINIKFKKPDKIDYKVTIIFNKTFETFLLPHIDSLKKEYKHFERKEKKDTIYYSFWNENIKPEKIKGLKIEKLEGGKYKIIYNLGEFKKDQEIYQAILSNYYLDLTIEVPGKVLQHNADRVKGRVLKWRKPLGNALFGGFQAVVVYKPTGGVKLFAIIIAIIGIVVVVLVIYSLLSGGKTKSEEEATET